MTDYPKLVPNEPIAPPDTEDIVVTKGGGKQSFIQEAFTELPPMGLAAIARVCRKGAEKYGSLNWHNISVRSELDHALRHAYKFLLEDNHDGSIQAQYEELSHAATRMIFALDQFLREVNGITPKQEN